MAVYVIFLLRNRVMRGISALGQKVSCYMVHVTWFYIGLQPPVF